MNPLFIPVEKKRLWIRDYKLRSRTIISFSEGIHVANNCYELLPFRLDIKNTIPSAEIIGMAIVGNSGIAVTDTVIGNSLDSSDPKNISG